MQPGRPRGVAGRVRPALIASAAVAVGLALARSNGAYDPVALGLVTLATAAALGALLLGRLPAPPPAGTRDAGWGTAILALGIALAIACGLLVPPGIYVAPGTLAAVRPLLVATAAVVASAAWRGAPPWVARLRFPAVLALAAAMGALVIHGSPAPHIDVWHFQQLGAERLVHGLNPYAGAYPNIYGPGAYVYAPAVLSPDGLSVEGFPYPPLTLLLGAPAAAAGADVRWVALALLLVSAWAIRRVGEGAVAAELAGVLLLVQPRTLFVLEQAWTEPALVAGAAVAVLRVGRWRATGGAVAGASRPWLAAGVAAGVALGAKQYAPLVLFPVLFATPARGRWRAAAVAVAAAAVVAAPFALWDPRAFVRGVVQFQLAQPFRPDALSWLAAVARNGGPRLPVWPAFALAAATVALGIRRTIRLDQAVLAGAAAWLVLLLFNKQAFCNYYWAATGLLLCAVAAAAAPAGREAGPAAS